MVEQAARKSWITPLWRERSARIADGLAGLKAAAGDSGNGAGAALAGGLVSIDQAVKLASRPLTETRLRLLAKKPPPAPAALQARLDGLAAAYGEEVGVAVTDVSEGWTAGVDKDRPYPQQSVSKLWVAITVMKAVDAGRIDPDAFVTLTDADRSVFFQPVAYNIGKTGYTAAIDTGTLSVHVRRLREKVEVDPTMPERLVTVWGVGYRWEPR